MLKERARFTSRILITTNINDQVTWLEDPPAALTVTMPAGWYYPEQLAEDLAALMTFESGASGNIATYTSHIDHENRGLLGISATGGGLIGWMLSIKAADTRKLLCGGDVAEETVGDYHMGFSVVPAASLDPAAPAGVVLWSDRPHSNCWYPSETERRIDNRLESVVSTLVTLGGSVKTRDYSGEQLHGDNSISKLQSTILSWDFLTQADIDQCIYNWWLPSVKTGATFRYYPERSDTITRTAMTLNEQSTRNLAPNRIAGYPLYSLELSMRRV